MVPHVDELRGREALEPASVAFLELPQEILAYLAFNGLTVADAVASRCCLLGHRLGPTVAESSRGR